MLSKKGWIRLAKGHDIDAKGLSYKSGDGVGQIVRGRSDYPIIFVEVSGRIYTLFPEQLPQQGAGEPLSKHLALVLVTNL